MKLTRQGVRALGYSRRMPRIVVPRQCDHRRLKPCCHPRDCGHYSCPCGLYWDEGAQYAEC